MKYVIYIHNRMALKSLGWKTPLEVLTRQMPDIGNIYQMPYRTIVYYSKYNDSFPNKTLSEEIGYFVGFVETVSHNNTFLVLSHDTNKILARSRIWPAEDLLNKQLIKILDKGGESYDNIDNLESTKQLHHLPFIDDNIQMDDINFDEYESSSFNDKKVKPLTTIPIEDLEGRLFLLPSEPDGTHQRAEILKVYDNHKKGWLTNLIWLNCELR